MTMPLTGAGKDLRTGVAALYRRYAAWLVSISWKRFVVLSVVLLIVANIVAEMPPFTWVVSERTVKGANGSGGDVAVTVDEHGVRIAPKHPRSQQPEVVIDEHGVQVRRSGEEIIIDEHGVRRRSAKDQEPDTAVQAQSELTARGNSLAQEIRHEIIDAIRNGHDADRVVTTRLGDPLPELAFLFIMISAAIKIAYASSVTAQAVAAQATHVAEEESLKRQVVEAKMAAMQAQVEPHFLFNTLASIDHLIETDPPRASAMQKNLIALLRASMPAMRDKTSNLGRELDVVRPYLEILKVRMAERLQAQLNVPEGLYSAQFPPMMLQSVVENAIKHGLEPKTEGGSLAVNAEIVHGKLVITVADTGVGFAQAATAGTGTGLTNIRERLKLIYGDAAELRIEPNAAAGTRVAIVVPYKAT